MIQLFWRSPGGILMKPGLPYSRLEYIRAEGKVGWLEMEIDPVYLPISWMQLNSRLEPWRSVGTLSPYLDGDTVFLLRKWGYKIDTNGRELLTVKAYDPNDLLKGHIVAYAEGSAEAEQTAAADNMMKEIIRHNLGSDSTDTARSLATWLTVGADVTLGPSIVKSFPRRIVLDILAEIAADSLYNGTYLTWDIVYTGAATLEFRTYTGQRGVNHNKTSAQPIIISRERGNLDEPEYVEDHTDECNVIYSSSATILDSVASVGLNRREKWINNQGTDNPLVQPTEARSGLYENRPRKTLTGRIIDNEYCRYGLHYKFGDLVYAEYRGFGFDAHINAIQVTCENGRETVNCMIKGEA